MKRVLLKFSICTSILMLCVSAYAQQVTGTLHSSTGEPLSGASIMVKGTTKSAITNNNGQFSIDAPAGSTLIVTSVGFQQKELTVTGSPINEILQLTNASLNEVVVIGYQSVRRKDLTGATGIVNMADANKVSGATIAESIQGLVPGVTVRNGGAPGQNAVIEIRGVGSFGNSNPLYVIDGMLSDANSTINTDDIASVQILKDASAAAIYGSRAGNGVIIITTKKGREGPSKIFGSAKYGTQQIAKTWDVMSAPQYLQTVKQEYLNSGQNLPSDITAQLANSTINTDWQKEAFQNGAYQDYNVGVSGGSKTGNYLLSGSYYKNAGTLTGNGFERASLRMNTEAKKGILTVGENMVLSSTYGFNPGGGVNAFYNSAQMLPTIAVQSSAYTDPNQYPTNPAGWGIGSTNNPTYVSNYLANVALDKQTYNYAKIVGNAYAQLNFTKWLSYRFNLGAEASFDYHKEVRDTGIWRYTNQAPLTSISEARSRFTNFLMEHTLNFNKSFGLHSINGVVGFSRTQHKSEYTNASRTILQYVNGQMFTTIGSSLGTPSADGSIGYDTYRNHGYLGRINYTYADKYLVTLTGRIDQDSRFGPNYRTGYFPSAAVAWRVNKEKFFDVSWISDLKLRASYGKLGFSDVLQAWGYFGSINSNPRAVYGASQTPVLGQYQASITNPDLRWETRIQKNLGLDASLFNNTVSLTAEVYHSVSSDVLVSVPLPAYLGSIGSPFINTGRIKNTGVEVALTYRNNSHAFKWDVSGNFTTIKNTVLSVGNQGVDAKGNKVDYLEPADFTRSQVGHSLGSWYVLKTAGIFQTQDEVNNYKNKDGKVIQPDAKPGDIKYVDNNADGEINNEDRSFAGSPWPTLQSGLQLNGSYKQFSINIQLVGVFGYKIYDDVRRALDNYQLTNFRTDINPWSTTNTSTSDPRLALETPTDPSVSKNNLGNTDRWLENGSYVRLRNIEIGYTFAQDLLKNISFSSARVYISAQNLFTITKYKGLDPDISNGNILERGLDAGFWPSSRIFSAGVQFEF